MENIITRTSQQFGSVRTIAGTPQLWCASDVAKALGYSNAFDAVSRHCRAIVKRDTPISGKVQKINYIPEADVYRLICHSKLPKAQEFERWVFEDVVPQAVHGETESRELYREPYSPHSSMISLLGYIERQTILISEYRRRLLNASTNLEAEVNRQELVKALKELKWYILDAETIRI